MPLGEQISEEKKAKSGFGTHYSAIKKIPANTEIFLLLFQPPTQGCQIFLAATYQTGTIFQMTTKCMQWTRKFICLSIM
jgi:hypothetical protein